MAQPTLDYQTPPDVDVPVIILPRWRILLTALPLSCALAVAVAHYPIRHIRLMCQDFKIEMWSITRSITDLNQHVDNLLVLLCGVVAGIAWAAATWPFTFGRFTYARGRHRPVFLIGVTVFVLTLVLLLAGLGPCLVNWGLTMYQIRHAGSGKKV